MDVGAHRYGGYKGVGSGIDIQVSMYQHGMYNRFRADARLMGPSHRSFMNTGAQVGCTSMQRSHVVLPGRSLPSTPTVVDRLTCITGLIVRYED